jgi:hypothetical protein
VKRGMALERADVGRKKAEADRAAAVAVVDAVDQRREFLAPVIVGGEQVGLMAGRGNQVEQHDTDAERLIARDAAPELIEPREQEAGVPRLVKIGFFPKAAEIADPGKMDA